MSDSGVVLVLFLLGFVLYFVPAFVAGSRGHPNAMAIVALNLLLGWTFLGWAAALVWAFTGPAGTGAAPAGAEVYDEYGTVIEPKPVATEIACPMCAETIKAAAKVCRFCGHQIEQAPMGA